MLDTLAAAQSLEAAGLQPTHAQAIVTVIQSSGESAATKADLNTFKMELEADLSKTKADLEASLTMVKTSLEADLKASLAQMETRLYRALWIQAGGIVGALVGLIGTAIAVAYFLDRYRPS